MAQPRAEVRLTEIPAPQKIAPYAVAMAADVYPAVLPAPITSTVTTLGAVEDQDPNEPLATGRFILLHDPAGSAVWKSTFRIVTFIRASVEAEMGVDPMAAEVAWTWLVEALDGHQVDYDQAGGTATRVLSESFGVLDDRADAIDIEMRASWSPTNLMGESMENHLEAWADMVCAFAGLPPVPEGVTVLPRARRT
ncbi:DUF3000 domain-containing protein [Auritidibacter ignavus]|uniref:DUF3000 domain-containing protein n=1 Tax=Auritidibacter ignavus TaxID=678932 RepID=A0AAJ6AKL5_9MICC|nr:MULTISPECIES: DUF3000 domain-containing protein [Auritidibacter]PXA75846.1 DUF3000 domain-containing protein [Auritidibacter sp. NML120779]AXR75039.1 DUF3000 domain-containing protein [Auritidibacter sp. NML130574]PXA75900.1 DUF3000 domain-containing protein [Auritidibacter sp. NML100628]PXA81577.1 DUF3000 domain-containing protein [Auritidibacter sp. NML120636]WGH82771.1 DUF3000 domain-containing protein [Auritidibacter ignavus]